MESRLVHGHHILSCVWSPTISEQLVCKREVCNAQNVYAVAVMHGTTVISRVPRKNSAACILLLQRNVLFGVPVLLSRPFSVRFA